MKKRDERGRDPRPARERERAGPTPSTHRNAASRAFAVCNGLEVQPTADRHREQVAERDRVARGCLRAQRVAAHRDRASTGGPDLADADVEKPAAERFENRDRRAMAATRQSAPNASPIWRRSSSSRLKAKIHHIDVEQEQEAAPHRVRQRLVRHQQHHLQRAVRSKAMSIRSRRSAPPLRSPGDRAQHRRKRGSERQHPHVAHLEQLVDADRRNPHLHRRDDEHQQHVQRQRRRILFRRPERSAARQPGRRARSWGSGTRSTVKTNQTLRRRAKSSGAVKRSHNGLASANTTQARSRTTTRALRL